MKSLVVALVILTSFLSGCASTPHHHEHIVKLTAVGYGSASAFERYTEGQKRLMAMRASKLDAYRSLAEQIYGVRVTGNSTVASMMVTNDNFRVYVDAYVRGARVTNVTQMADGNYETTVEMDFDTAVVKNFSHHAHRGAVHHAYVGVRGDVGPGNTYGATYYHHSE
jgi:outer membrane protein FlgP